MSASDYIFSKHNRLINEQSPYLLQHASNPVDWYPWSEEAFHVARKEDKPIFLSIGYSTCHWCHVNKLPLYNPIIIGSKRISKFIGEIEILFNPDKSGEVASCINRL